MRITRVSVYRRPLTYVGKAYGFGPGRSFSAIDTVVVVLDTDEGLSGCGECCPLPSYLAADADGVVGLAGPIAEALLGHDPRQVERIGARMDARLLGHGYAKSPFDAACWDLLGKSVGQPVWMLLGGRLNDGGPMYRVIPQQDVAATVAELAEHRAAGYRQFQLKVGADPVGDIDRIRATVELLEPGETLFADANTGWTVDDAVRVARATADLDYVFEQPCLTYDECLQVRQRTTLPMKLDECMTDLRSVERAVADGAAEVICLKVHKHGGISRTRRIRDYLVEHRVPMVVEDAWGGEIVTAAHSHLVASTPAELLVSTTDLHHYVEEPTGIGGATTSGGRLLAPDGPGLGVEPDLDSLGGPVAVFELEGT